MAPNTCNGTDRTCCASWCGSDDSWSVTWGVEDLKIGETSFVRVDLYLEYVSKGDWLIRDNLDRDLISGILVVCLNWETEVTQVTGVDYLLGETGSHKEFCDCFGDSRRFGIGKTSVMRLVVGITGKIGTVLLSEVKVSLFVMELIGQLWAIRLIN